jgi:hypothetical protein
MDNIIYNWSFNDSTNRGKLWYIIAISFVLWLVVWWIFTKQYWLSFIILFIAWIAFYVENNSSDVVEVFINDSWVKIWGTFYDFSKIESYSIIYSWEQAILLRLTFIKKWFNNQVDLKINNEIWKDLKGILPNYIQENKDGELTSSEKLISFLKL